MNATDSIVHSTLIYQEGRESGIRWRLAGWIHDHASGEKSFEGIHPVSPDLAERADKILGSRDQWPPVTTPTPDALRLVRA